VNRIKIPNPDYESYSTRKLLLIPILVFIIAISILVFWTMMTGLPVDRGIEFVGGTEIRLSVGDDISNTEQTIEETYSADTETIVPIPGSGNYIVSFESGSITSQDIEDQTDANEDLTLVELNEVSPTLGEDVQERAMIALIFSLFLMSAFVILLFRSFIPAVAVIASTVSNIAIPLAAMNIIGMELSLGAVGALLMLIGYSVDSDILLNKHVLKGDKMTFNENVYDSMNTGVFMTVTALSAMIVMSIIASLFSVGILVDMGIILAIGLTSDLMNTYLMNVGLLKWYTERGDYYG